MLEWLGEEGDSLRKSFIHVFGARHRAFGNRAGHVGGLCDDNEGVQWNAGYDPRDGRRWVGVNLEGMRYDGWPVARLIERELGTPTLPRLVRDVGPNEPARVVWTRDFWQVTARPEIVEGRIAPTPIALGGLTEGLWCQALTGALACLDPDRGRRGRAQQEVTRVATGHRERGGVSPHLTIELPATPGAPWLDFLADAKARMQPFHDWAMDRAR